MRLSICLPQTGAIAGPAAIVRTSRLAEDLGFDGLWVLDRLLAPLSPAEPYPVSADGSLPVQFQRVLDPLATLAFAAARTTRVALGTSVLATPWYNPMVLARQLAAIDVLSGGRLKVGLGTGWSTDENRAAGAPCGDRGRRTDEFVATMIAAWTDDVVTVDGAYTQVPASRIDLKPVQRPHPPLYFAAYAPASMRRIARFGAGWNPAGVPLEALPGMFSAITQMAADAGRDPSAVEMVVRANVTLTDVALASDRAPFAGTMAQVLGDIERCREIGADEVVVDAQFTSFATSADRYDEFVTDLAAAALPVPVLA
ncbi:MAG: putative hydride transferase [Ilumatobacteraceae bacterium]|nr:putative hydride transferase [Ilumatobacteraceae bacterium]